MSEIAASFPFARRVACRHARRLFTRVALFGVLASTFLISSPALAQDDGDDVLARVAGQDVTRAEAETLVRAELTQIDRQRHELVTAATQRLIEMHLLEAEAARRGVGVEVLQAEIEAEVGEVSEQEVDLWYQRNQARIRQPKAQVADQIRAYLANERRQQITAQKVAGLREHFPVDLLIEPYRVELDLDGTAVGPADAAVTLVEYGDFECPPCGRLHGDLKKLKAEYGDRVRFVFEHFPLESIHPRARGASQAAFCAGEQGKFWEMHDALFENQRQLDVAALQGHATALGLDADAFASCLDSDAARDAVNHDLAAGRSVGVGSTPTLFVNGRLVSLAGGSPYQILKETLDAELASAGS